MIVLISDGHLQDCCLNISEHILCAAGGTALGERQGLWANVILPPVGHTKMVLEAIALTHTLTPLFVNAAPLPSPKIIDMDELADRKNQPIHY